MHSSSLREMRRFVRGHMRKRSKLSVLDVGSLDVNGSYKRFFENSNWSYTGLDLCSGENVDIVADSVYKYPVADESYDVVISGQTIEHVENVYLWFAELVRCLKKGGLLCVIGPYKWPEHLFPIDCWRVLPGGMSYLMRSNGLTELACYINRRTDCVGIGRK